jgi:hypothetical protein
MHARLDIARSTAVAVALVLAAALGAGCRESEPTGAGGLGLPPGPRIAAGTPFEVRLSHGLSSETAKVGDPWTGVTARDLIVDDQVAIPAGSSVRGTVVGARPAAKGARAMLELAVRSVSVGGRTTSVSAESEPVIAGSTRARNLGAIAGGAAAGALIGKAVGGDGRDAALGGLIGGAAATGVVAGSKGYQVVLKSGTVMDFTVSRTIALR